MAKEAKEKEEKKELKIQALLKVYFLSGQHCDIKVAESEGNLLAAVEELGRVGVWAKERDEVLFFRSAHWRWYWVS